MATVAALTEVDPEMEEGSATTQQVQLLIGEGEEPIRQSWRIGWVDGHRATARVVKGT